MWTGGLAILAAIAGALSNLETIGNWLPPSNSTFQHDLTDLRRDFDRKIVTQSAQTQRALDQVEAAALEARIEALAANIAQMETQYVILDVTPDEQRTVDLRVRLSTLRREIDTFREMLARHRAKLIEIRERLSQRLSGGL